MIEEDYVSFETAKLLKEKRFPQSAFKCHYIITDDGYYKSFEDRCGFGDYDIIAPTLAMAMKWLREVHGIFTIVQPNFQPDCIKFDAYILPYHPDKTPNAAISMAMCEDTYEAVCDEAIKYCLENLI